MFVTDDDGKSPSPSCIGRLRFHQFDMAKVLANSSYLLASEGREFDLEEDPSLGKNILQNMELFFT